MTREPRFYAVTTRASGENGTLYNGGNGEFVSRIAYRKSNQVTGLTARCDITKPGWRKDFEVVQLAIQREKTMKK
jgi:predicted GIY-YIG superfamily endonuclease